MKQQEKIIPNGMRAASFTLEGNKMTIFFEPEKYVPKVGDLVRNISTEDSRLFSIYVFKEFDERGDAVNFGDYIHQKGVQSDKGQIPFDSEFSIFEKLTPEEFQAEFEKLGYVYDFETHTARKKRKRVAKGGMYYYADSALKACKLPEQGDDFDDEYFALGNYFETKADCQKYCDYMKECSLKYFDK